MGPRADTCGERKVHGAGREGGTVDRGESGWAGKHGWIWVDWSQTRIKVMENIQ